MQRAGWYTTGEGIRIAHGHVNTPLLSVRESNITRTIQGGCCVGLPHTCYDTS